MAYFNDIKSGIRTTLSGLALTLKHLRQATKSRTPMGIASDNYFDQQTGIVTLQYPHEHFPIPDNGRYRLHNEMDDCIVCDKCAKVCPVDCITIDPIKATGEVGRASDGSPIRLYAETFDIDMAKCCFCGLCTVVCPTECLTMEKTFDFSEFELGKLTYHFANLTPEQADEKRALYEQFVREKEVLKAQQTAAKAPAIPTEATAVPAKSAGFRPTVRPAPQPAPDEPTTELPATETGQSTVSGPTAPNPKPAFRPTLKPKIPLPNAGQNSSEGSVLHPLTDPAPDEAEQIAMAGITDNTRVTEPMTEAEIAAPVEPLPTGKPAAFRPTMKPPAKPVPPDSVLPPEPTLPPDLATAQPIPKPAFRPTMKPKGSGPATDTPASG